MRFLVLATTLFLGACAVYIPRGPDNLPPPGTQVKAELTSGGSVRASESFGAPIRLIEGKIAEVEGDTVTFSLLSATEYGRPWESDLAVSVHRSEILQLDEKRIDRKKTAFLVGGLGVASGVVVAALFNAAGGKDKGGRPGEIDVALIPLISIRH